MRHLGILLAALAFALPAEAGGDSSDGHTHAAPEPLIVVPTGPRTSAATEDFELVGVLDGKVLTLYLDRFASNAPVAKAQIEVESAALKAVAVETSPGVYRVAAEALAKAGTYPLTISVHSDDAADLLNATLVVGEQGAPADHAHVWSEWAVWSAAALLLLLGGGLLGVRRRRHGRRQPRTSA